MRSGEAELLATRSRVEKELSSPFASGLSSLRRFRRLSKSRALFLAIVNSQAAKLPSRNRTDGSGRPMTIFKKVSSAISSAAAASRHVALAKPQSRGKYFLYKVV